MRVPRTLVLMAIIAVAALAGTGCTKAQKTGEIPTLTVMTHDSFKISGKVIRDFEQANGCKVAFLKSGDAGAALNQAILSKKNPLADVFFGVDNTFMSRALTADIFEPYASPLVKDLAGDLMLDKTGRLLPVDFGDVCLNYDKAWFEHKGMKPPSSLEDLVKPQYRDLTVVENPATSSPGLAFLLATIGHFGENAYLGYWTKLKANGVLVTNGWDDAYWGQFSAASKGTRPIVVSYASSPSAEVYYAKKPLKEAPTAALVSPGTAFRQVEFAGILKGTKNAALARKFIDYMLDMAFQEDIPLQMFVFPANTKARLPEVFTLHARVADKPVTLDPAIIAANRDKWLEAWTDAVLR
ncbi:MAG: thiamine ABC transporter substrate-binding protein [Syntrophaceae bacterium]|nr:thiamine ABC transporter substrate-binding protein [Deltaproteobacteria bacterium]